jgi:hypothetical protein
MKKKPNSFEWGHVRFIPVLHNRLEFALEVRKQFTEFRPDHLAIEFPPSLKEAILEGIKRLPLLSVVHYQERDGTFVYLPLEPTDGQVEALRLALALNIPIHFIDRDTEGYPLDQGLLPDSYAVAKIGHYQYCKAFMLSQYPQDRNVADNLREKTMAFHLQRLNQKNEKVLWVGGLYHLKGLLELLEHPQTEVIGLRRREHVGLAHLHQESCQEILTEMPYLNTQYEKNRSQEGLFKLDRLQVNQELIELARQAYYKNDKEELGPGQLKILYRFARNYALINGGLVPSFYQLLIAARGAVDDNFAYEVWQKGIEYPWQSEAPGLPVLRLYGEDLFLDLKRIRFHRRLKTFRRRLISVPIRKKKREKTPGEWKKNFKGGFICSYPPEDVVVEGYGRYLQKKALAIKAEERSSILPFSSSMLDGLDLRQTLREWPDGNIFVKEFRPLRGKVGSVVMIFDPDYADNPSQEQYPWCVTWLGEHEQESDMAFYSTPAGEVMDGPGISRCQYGGFMLTYPPLRVYDIWKDSFFSRARSKPEKLLMAAIDYSLEKHVVYVAAEPPSGWCQSIASRLGKKIIYIPIGAFSPVTIKKIKQFHVLDGHHVRRYAREYL